MARYVLIRNAALLNRRIFYFDSIEMITKYFTQVFVRFDPFSKEAKSARLFLSSIPPFQRTRYTKIKHELLVGNTTKEPIVKVTFNDKTELELNPKGMVFDEVSNFFDRHSRKLRIKEITEVS